MLGVGPSVVGVVVVVCHGAGRVLLPQPAAHCAGLLVAKALDPGHGLLPAELGRRADDDDRIGVRVAQVHGEPLVFR